MTFDIFICHASEDKDNFVRPMAHILQQFGVKVWYDELSLAVGDSLSRSIDRGLSQSQFGLVVLSPDFLKKDWPEYELRGLLAKEIGSSKVILPVWHKLKRDELLRYSPPLADKLAIRSDSQSLVKTAVSIIQVVRPDLFEKVMRRATYLERTWNATTTKVDIAKIKSSPPVHDELPFNLISRIRLIRAALLDVYPNSMLYWIEGFRRDAHPSREVRIWEHVGSCYLEYVAANSLSKEQRKSVFSIVFALSICISEDELAKKASLLPLNALTELVRLWKTEVLTNDVGQIPFPSHYEMSEQSMERLKLLDTEQFPYDIPDELVFELLKQKPLDDA